MNPKFDYRYKTVTLDLTSERVNEELEIFGERIRYISGSTNLSIRLLSTENDNLTLKPGGTIVAPFNKVFISHDAAPGETAELVFIHPAFIDVHDNDVTVDSISNLASLDLVDEITVNKLLERDTSKQYDTLNSKNTYWGGAVRSGVAATYAHVGLWNPGTNSKLLILKHLIITNSSSGTQQFKLSNYGAILSVSAYFQGCKYSGEADGDGQVATGVPGSIQGTLEADFYVPQYTSLPIPVDDNYVIDENTGLYVSINNVNSACSAIFQWQEVDAP